MTLLCDSKDFCDFDTVSIALDRGNTIVGVTDRLGTGGGSREDVRETPVFNSWTWDTKVAFEISGVRVVRVNGVEALTVGSGVAVDIKAVAVLLLRCLT